MFAKSNILDAVEFIWSRCPRRVRHSILRRVQTKFLIGTLGIISNQQGQVLLLEHRFRITPPWGLPGGFLQRNEDPSVGLARELYEETGLHCTINPNLYEMEFDKDVSHATLIFCGNTRGTHLKLSSEIKSGGFFGVTDLPQDLYEPHRLLLERWFASGTFK